MCSSRCNNSVLSSRYITVLRRTSRNVQRFIKFHQGSSRFIKTHQYSSTLIEIHKDESKIHQGSSRHIEIARDFVKTCTKVSSRHIEIARDFVKTCTKVHQETSRFHQRSINIDAATHPDKQSRSSTCLQSIRQHNMICMQRSTKLPGT